jgi:biotin-dependent carboxylase-like uncharacterized protein
MSGSITIHSPGILSLIQDLGRAHMLPYAVPTCGAMDVFAHIAANTLVGNDPTSASIEITGGGATIEFKTETLFAITGADFAPTLNGRRLQNWLAIFARRGDVLTLSGRQGAWGARAYLTCAGGFDVPKVLDSHSTYLPGKFGGYFGRALQSGDDVAIKNTRADVLRWAGRSWAKHQMPAYGQPNCRVRIVPGPHDNEFKPQALTDLVRHPIRVTSTSNRMGYRFSGCSALNYAKPISLPSLGVVPGVIQVPPDGSPILLTADAQTTGGYPLIAVVIQADLPLVGQCLPGDDIWFEWTTMTQAIAAWQTFLHWVAMGCEEGDDIATIAWRGAV